MRWRNNAIPKEAIEISSVAMRPRVVFVDEWHVVAGGGGGLRVNPSQYWARRSFGSRLAWAWVSFAAVSRDRLPVIEQISRE